MPEIDLLLGVHRPGLPLVPQVGTGRRVTSCWQR